MSPPLAVAIGVVLGMLQSDPATFPISKLADEYYDEFHETCSHTPPLKARIVNNRPSPGLSFLPLPASAPSPESDPSGKRRRHGRTRPTQGDEVLIDILANQQRPDLAEIAGREPLDPDYHSCSDDEMVEKDQRDQDAVQIARSASLLADGQDVLGDVIDDQPGSNTQTRVRPTVLTTVLPPHGEAVLVGSFGKQGCQDIAVLAGEKSRFGPEVSQSNENKTTISPEPNYTVESNMPSRASSPKLNGLTSTHQAWSGGSSSSDVKLKSPNLRQYAIPISEGSPMETLPAMQSSPPQTLKSPKGQHSLPSLHAQLGSLADAPTLQENSNRSNGIGHQGRPPFSSINSSVHSPPNDLNLSHATQFTTIQNRASGRYPPVYPSTQPSPASSLSEASSRDAFIKGQDLTNMSPPGRVGAHYSNGMIPQNELPTPISAGGYPSTSSFSADTSPNGDRMNIDEGRSVLPPPPGSASSVNGNFKCDHDGCTAPPFQTQYLLK
ncbi:MAG: hypothetical protein Q9187_001508 [Circinaria calcarea]